MLLVAERRGRIRTDEVEERLRFLLGLPVKTDTEPDLAAALVLAGNASRLFYDGKCFSKSNSIVSPISAVIESRNFRWVRNHSLPCVDSLFFR